MNALVMPSVSDSTDSTDLTIWPDPQPVTPLRTRKQKRLTVRTKKLPCPLHPSVSREYDPSIAGAAHLGCLGVIILPTMPCQCSIRLKYIQLRISRCNFTNRCILRHVPRRSYKRHDNIASLGGTRPIDNVLYGVCDV